MNLNGTVYNFEIRAYHKYQVYLKITLTNKYLLILEYAYITKH